MMQSGSACILWFVVSMPRKKPNSAGSSGRNEQHSIRSVISEPRRQILKAVGAGATLPIVSGVAAAKGEEANDGEETDTTWPQDCPPFPCIDATFGLPLSGSGKFDKRSCEGLCWWRAVCRSCCSRLQLGESQKQLSPAETEDQPTPVEPLSRYQQSRSQERT